MLNQFRSELSVAALPHEMASAADATVAFLQSRAARVSVSAIKVESGRLEAEVSVENLGGHKLPTAYPSRRAWLHLTVRDRNGATVFESGALRPDGSIAGNDNDADPQRYEPHYTVIDDPGQVQIYEDIRGDVTGKITTGLVTALTYLKDNRLLPRGFHKHTAEEDIAVVGNASDDPDFTDAGHRMRYRVPVESARGPFRVQVELYYQPIGYRWANNLRPYGSQAMEPRRFTGYYDAMSNGSAVIVGQASGLSGS
jgi:hypothetical protein